MKNLLLIAIIVMVLNLFFGGLRGSGPIVDLPEKQDPGQGIPLCKCGDSCECCEDFLKKKK